MSETTITKEQLNTLWNAIEYTRGTIGTGAFLQSDERPDWIEIHRGRARQSNAFLNQSLEIINQLKRETEMTNLSPKAKAIVDAYDNSTDKYDALAAVLRALIEKCSEPRGTGRVDKISQVVSVKTLMELTEELENY